MGSVSERRRRWRNQCDGCNLLVNLRRLVIVDDDLLCLDCAPDSAEPWYIDSDD